MAVLTSDKPNPQTPPAEHDELCFCIDCLGRSGKPKGQRIKALLNDTVLIDTLWFAVALATIIATAAAILFLIVAENDDLLWR